MSDREIDIADLQVEGPGVWRKVKTMEQKRKEHRRRLLIEQVELFEQQLRGPKPTHDGAFGRGGEQLVSVKVRDLRELLLLVREVLLDP